MHSGRGRGDRAGDEHSSSRTLHAAAHRRDVQNTHQSSTQFRRTGARCGKRSDGRIFGWLVGAQFSETNQCAGVVVALARAQHDVVAAILPLDRNHTADVPQRGMEKQQRLGDPLDPVDQRVAPPNVGQFVDKDGFEF